MTEPLGTDEPETTTTAQSDPSDAVEAPGQATTPAKRRVRKRAPKAADAGDEATATSSPGTSRTSGEVEALDEATTPAKRPVRKRTPNAATGDREPETTTTAQSGPSDVAETSGEATAPTKRAVRRRAPKTADGEAAAPPAKRARRGAAAAGADPAVDAPAAEQVASVTTEPTVRKPAPEVAAPDAEGPTVAKVAAAEPTEAGESEEPADRWSQFATATEPSPTRSDRGLTAVGRFFRHEWTLACIAALVLAVVMTWPTLRYPQYELPQDIWDPTLQAWQMAWSGHILLTDPAQLYNSNTFYPSHLSFAFSDGLLGYAPFGMIGTGPIAAVLRYNIVFVLAHALAALGAYALVRQLGAGRIGAAVAGVSYAYAPWLLAQSGHLHILSNGGIPLAFAMLARGHGWSLRRGYRPDRRHAGWAAAGWITAAWQLSLGFGIGLVFAYVLGATAVVVAVVCLTRRIWFGRKLFYTDLLGGALFAATGGLLAIPFFKVAEENPNAVRSLAEIDFFSPPWRGFFTAPAESRIWGAAHAPVRDSLPWHPEMTLLPGFILIGLAIAGLFFSIWRVRVRLALLAAVAVSVILAMGTQFFGGKVTYVPLFDHLPGWDGLRTPGRLVLWTTLLLGVLAAGAVSAFVDRVDEVAAQRVPPWPNPWLRIATLIPLVLVLVEGLNSTPHVLVPTQPAAMRTVEGPLLVLPSDQPTDQNVMLWSTTKFQPIVNGGSGFTPASQEETRKVASTFPDAASIDYLRKLGIRNVIILRDRVAHTPWEATVDLPVDALGIQRQDIGDAVVYRLSP